MTRRGGEMAAEDAAALEELVGFCEKFGLRLVLKPDEDRLGYVSRGFVQFVNTNSRIKNKKVQVTWQNSRHVAIFGKNTYVEVGNTHTLILNDPRDWKRTDDQIMLCAVKDIINYSNMPPEATPRMKFSNTRSLRMLPSGSLAELAFKMETAGKS